MLAKTLVYQRANRLGKLAGELMAGVPALRPVLNTVGELVSVASFSGDGVSVTIYCPDNTPEPTVAAIVAAHDPTTPSATEARDALRATNAAAWRADLRDSRARAALLAGRVTANTATAAETRELLALQARLLDRLGKVALDDLD